MLYNLYENEFDLHENEPATVATVPTFTDSQTITKTLVILLNSFQLRNHGVLYS